MLAEQLIRNLGNKPVAIGAERVVPGVKDRVRATPNIEITTGEDDPAIHAVTQRSLGSKRVHLIGQVRSQTIGDTRIELLIFMDVSGSKSDPVTVTLVLILRVQSDIAELVSPRTRGRRWQIGIGEHAKRADLPGMLAPVGSKATRKIGLPSPPPWSSKFHIIQL
jgi:hypothetical protein